MARDEDYIESLAEGIDEAMKQLFNHPMGFCLLVFEFGIPEMGNYVSNAERSDMILALRETAKRLEAGEDIPKTIGGIQ